MHQKRKTHLIWTLKRNWFAEMNSLWSNKGPNFIIIRAWQLFADWVSTHTYSVQRWIWDWILGFPRRCPTGLHHLSQLLQERPDSVFLPVDWACPVQSELHSLDTPLHKMDLIRNLGGNSCYKKQPLFCLSGTRFRLLFESTSPRLQLLLLQ